jgi:hypothetical protein
MLPSRYDEYIPNTLELSSRDMERLLPILSSHLDKAEALYTALLDESGTLLAEAQIQNISHKEALGCLATSAVAAVSAISQTLGDGPGSGFFHQGTKFSFAVTPVTVTSSLLTVYGPDARLGIVRGAITLTTPRLAKVLGDLIPEVSPRLEVMPEEFMFTIT